MTNAELDDLEAALRRGADVDVEAPADTATRAAIGAADREGLVDVAIGTVESPVGDLFVAVTARGLVRLAFDPEQLRLLDDLAARISPRVLEATSLVDPVRRELDEYFAGRRRQFDLEVDLSLTSGWGRRVLEATARIPAGQVATYGTLAARAAQAGRGPRRRQRRGHQPGRDRRAVPPRRPRRRRRRQVRGWPAAKGVSARPGARRHDAITSAAVSTESAARRCSSSRESSWHAISRCPRRATTTRCSASRRAGCAARTTSSTPAHLPAGFAFVPGHETVGVDRSDRRRRGRGAGASPPATASPSRCSSRAATCDACRRGRVPALRAPRPRRHVRLHPGRQARPGSGAATPSTSTSRPTPCCCRCRTRSTRSSPRCSTRSAPASAGASPCPGPRPATSSRCSVPACAGCRRARPRRRPAPGS